MRKMLMKLVNSQQDDSLPAKQRKERYEVFKSFISQLRSPISVLDVGGTPKYWKNIGFAGEHGMKVVILNTVEEQRRSSESELSFPDLTAMVGDARDMEEFGDNGFDVVFSNSVIEHVGDYTQQRRMAEEVRRVGRKYFIQTPNRFFPIEPHFVFPFFQFLPLRLKVYLLCNFRIGAWDWSREISDKQTAEERANSIRLLTERELKELFPGGSVYREKFLGLTKSFIIYGDADM
jgi:hypothetical protein